MITDILVRKIIEQLGIKKDVVDKIQAFIDNLDIETKDGKTVISINKKISIVIEN